jgi:hypothetical protein
MFGFGKPPAKPLRLIANEAHDVPPLAALVQDAALRAGDLSYVPGERHFTIRMNRFCHEVASSTPLRAPSVLRINCVKKVQVRGIDPVRRDAPLSLLTISVEPLDEPACALTLHFAGGGRDVRLEVECIDVLLLDLAAPRRARSRPNHPVD